MSGAQTQHSSSLLDGDGVTEHLFHKLWEKDDLNLRPAIAIPDTIVIKNGKLQSWYFTAADGKIKRKTKKKLHLEQVEHVFVTRSVGYDVVATFIQTAELQDDPGGRNTVYVFNAAQLREFLTNPTRPMTGILQKFVESKGVCNGVIRAIWSPKVCLLEKRENIHYLHDTRMGTYERVITYEGPEYYSRPAPLRGSGIASELQRICDTVVSHVAEVTYHDAMITRCVLHFKVDSRDQAWLLYSTSIRLSTTTNTQAVNMDNVLHLPSEVILTPAPSHSREDHDQAPTKQQENCVACDTLVLSTQLYPVTYKVIIDFYENVTQVLNDEHDRHRSKKRSSSRIPDGTDVDEDDDEQIPPILRTVHPRLTAKLFRKFRHDPVFLYRSCNVCEACFLQHAEYANTSLVVGPSLSSFLKPGNHAPATTRMTRQEDEAAWKSLSAFHRRAQSPAAKPKPPPSSIETRTSPALVRPPPEFPATITTSTDFRQTMQQEYSTGLATSSSNFDVQSMIAEREQQFFNELAKNKHTKTHHPLTHLITTQRKLLAAEQQAGLKGSSSVSQGQDTRSPWFANYSSQPKKDSLTAYRAKLSAVVPSEFTNRLRRSKTRKKKDGNMSATLSSADISLSETAASHQKFLQDALLQFQSQAGDQDVQGP